MIIKRKSNYAVSTDIAVKRRLPQNKKLGYGKYILPRSNVVPADQYYSEIVHIEDTTTRAEKEAIAVYYKIVKFSDAYQKANSLGKHDGKLNIFYIKQIYPLDSDAYRLFLEAMYNYLEIDYEDDIDLELCIGLTEAISIGYTSPTGIGGINSRCYWDDEAFVELYQEQYAPASNIDDCNDVEYDEYGNVI